MMRCLLLAFFIISLASFVHFRDVRIDVVELGSRAGGYIVAQVDFAFPDNEATLILKREAVRDVDSIYKIDESQVKKNRVGFENFIIKSTSWRQELRLATFSEVYNAADVVEEYLIAAKITDERTYSVLTNNGGIEESYYPIKEHITKNHMVLPKNFWKEVSSEIVRKYSFPKSVVDYVIHYFEHTAWVLDKDDSTMQYFRHTVEASIPEKYTRIKAGKKIVDQGEVISKRHIEMLKSMKKAINEQRNLLDFRTIFGSILFASVITAIALAYIRVNARDLFLSLSKLSLFVTIIVITLLLCKIFEYAVLHTENRILSSIRYPLLIPFASVLVCVLINKNLALFTTILLSVVCGSALVFNHTDFIFANIVTGMAIILFTKSLRKRKDVFLAAMSAWVASIPLILAFMLSSNQFSLAQIATDCIGTLGTLIAISILIIGLLPALESFFDIMTDITLMEFMDPSNELLSRLSIEAPGTYQHSLVVGTLSESAAYAIGANGLFCKVSSLYHDVGKLFNPHYFTENQMGGFDVHKLLTPKESAQVIISHVSEGVTLAKKHRLPRSFIDIIQEHHGTTQVFYFYCKEVELENGDAEKVDEEAFRYKGPKPYSKESAIIMIADSVEAASRSLDEMTEESITSLVNKIVSDKMLASQFDNTILSFEELGKVKRSIIRMLAISGHSRAKYPEKVPIKE